MSFILIYEVPTTRNMPFILGLQPPNPPLNPKKNKNGSGKAAQQNIR